MRLNPDVSLPYFGAAIASDGLWLVASGRFLSRQVWTLLHLFILTFFQLVYYLPLLVGALCARVLAVHGTGHSDFR